MKQNWMTNMFRMLHLDYHQPPWMKGVAEELTLEEARKQARMFKESGIQAVEVFAYDHYGQAFYWSEKGIVHPGLASDYTGIMTQALKEEGIKVILYLNVYTSVHLHKTNPEWLIRDRNGVNPRGAWLQHDASHLCPSSPYLEEYFIPLLQESINRHQPDAVWLDAGSWMFETPCYCSFCQQQYVSEMKESLPLTSQPEVNNELETHEWIRWRIWRRGQIYHYLQKIEKAVKSINPTILVTDNNSGKYHTGVPLVKNGEFIRWLKPAELGLDYLSCDPVPMGGNHELILSQESRYQATTGLPFNYMNERFHGWGEWQFRSNIDWKLESATMLAGGARCFFADQPYTEGTLEKKVYKDLKETFQFVQTFEPFAADSKIVPDVAILASAPSCLFGPTGGMEWGRQLQISGENVQDRTCERTDKINGAHLICTELGLQFLIYDEPTLRESLEQVSLVIIPDQALLEMETIQALEKYVSEGGKLLVTGRAGLWDEQGQRYSGDPLKHLLGLERTGKHPAPLHYLKGMLDVPLQVWGTAMQIQLHTANKLASLVEPREDAWEDLEFKTGWRHYTVYGATPPGKKSAGPGVTINRFGNGQAVFVCTDLFSLYYQEGHRLLRKCLEECVELLLPKEQRKIFVNKPLHVEISLMKQGPRNIVWLINYFAQKRPGHLVHNEEIPPIHGVEVFIQCSKRPKKVTIGTNNTETDYQWEQGILHVKVPQLSIAEVIVVEGE